MAQQIKVNSSTGNIQIQISRGAIGPSTTANVANTALNLNAASTANVIIGGGVANYVLQTDGAGNTSWVAQTGGGATNPAGANTQVQFNDQGSFGAESTFTYDKTTDTLTTGNLTATTSLFVDGVDGNVLIQPNVAVNGNTYSSVVRGEYNTGTGNSTTSQAIVTDNYTTQGITNIQTFANTAAGNLAEGGYINFNNFNAIGNTNTDPLVASALTLTANPTNANLANATTSTTTSVQMGGAGAGGFLTIVGAESGDSYGSEAWKQFQYRPKAMGFIRRGGNADSRSSPVANDETSLNFYTTQTSGGVAGQLYNYPAKIGSKVDPGWTDPNDPNKGTPEGVFFTVVTEDFANLEHRMYANGDTIFNTSGGGTPITLGYNGVITGDGGGLSNIAVANVAGIGNIATTNLDGNSANYLDGTGSWGPVSGGGGTPAGSNTQVQYNDNGAFGAEAGFEYDDVTNTLTVENIVATGEFFGDLDGAVSANVYNATGSTLNKGDAVYLTGGNNGDSPHIDLADADDPTKMPALGIVKENIPTASVGQVVTSGVMNDSSHGYTLGADLYVSTTPGQLTTTIPTGEANGIQKIGKVVSPNHIIVQGAFRTNQTPNLDDGNIFIGNATNQATTANLYGEINTHLAAFGSNTITTTGLITGDGGGLSNISVSAGSQIINGTSNVDIATANGNVDVTVNGNTVMVTTDTGTVIQNEPSGNITISPTLSTAYGAGTFVSNQYNPATMAITRRNGNSTNKTSSVANDETSIDFYNTQDRFGGSQTGVTWNYPARIGSKVDPTWVDPQDDSLGVPNGLFFAVVKTDYGNVEHRMYANGDSVFNASATDGFGNPISTNPITLGYNGVITGDGGGLSNIAVANVNGLGNIATVNLDGNTANYLNGTGSWAPVTASPGGFNDTIQFNNGGTLDGNSSFQFIPGSLPEVQLNGSAGSSPARLLLQDGILNIYTQDLSGGYSPFSFDTHNDAGGFMEPINYYRSRGTRAAQTAVQAGDMVKNERMQAYSGAGATLAYAGGQTSTVQANDGTGNLAVTTTISTARPANGPNSLDKIIFDTEFTHVAGNIQMNNTSASFVAGRIRQITDLFANLPASPVTGERAMITDGPGFNYGAVVSAGGGTQVMPVFWDGSDWRQG